MTALLVACDKPADTTTTPEPATKIEDGDTEAAKGEAEAEVAAAEGEGEGEGEGEAAKEPPKDSFRVATFNLAWAHDTIGNDPKLSLEQRAQKEEDWTWKIETAGKILAEADLDIIALHEVGGHLEVTELVDAIEKAGGSKYSFAFADSDDPRNGHHCAILSRFDVSEDRRFDIHLRRHTVGDVELPTGDTITVVAIHTPEGARKKPQDARRSQVEALVREVQQIREQHPVIVLGTLGSNVVPADEGYDESAAGMLAGANTRDEADDCDDSAAVGLVLETTAGGELADRIFTCGLKMRDAETVADDEIVRDTADKWDKPWPAVPIDKPPHRDLSDHLLLTAEIELPKKPPANKAGEGDEAEADG